MNNSLPMPPAEAGVVPFPPPPRPVDTPSRWPSILLCIGLLLGGAGGGMIATRYLTPSPDVRTNVPEEKKPDDGTVNLSPEKQAAAGIETAPVTASPLISHVWRTGRVALNDERLAHISPPAEGIIREVPVRLGQTVPAGAVLAVIDSRELSFLKLELVKARVALATERENVDRVQATMTNAAELLKLLAADVPLGDIEQKLADKPIGDWRSQLLGAYTRRNQLRAQLASQRSSSGAVPESIIRKTESEADAATAAYTALVEELRFQSKYQVRQAELKRREAETSVDVTKAKLMTFGLSAAAIEAIDPLAGGDKDSMLQVKAPFAGTIVEKHAVLSERVGPQSQMFVLSDLAAVWVHADIFEADLPLVRGLSDQSITFRSSVAGIADRTAKVVYTGDLFDKASRSLTLVAEAPNSDRLLKPGMFVEVGFDTGERTPVLQVPATAVLRHENKPFVFLASSDTGFTRIDVTLGRSTGDSVEIVSGLKLGDRVVTRGGFVLKSELLKDQMVGE